MTYKHEIRSTKYVRHIQLLLLLAILQLIIALFTNTLTFTHEESMWHYIGRNWFRHGMSPYSGGIDNKSPFIFAVYGFSDWLFGINYWFPRLIGMGVEFLGIYYIYKIAKQLAGERAGLLALSIYGLSLLWKTTGGKLVSFTETYATACIIISFYTSINKKYFLSGLLAGLGIGFRFSASFGALAVFIATIRTNVKGAILFSIGAITGLAIMAALIQLSGINVRDFLFYGFADNFGQGSTTDFTWQYKLDGFTNNFFFSELILFYPFVTGYILLKKRFDALIVWIICTFIGVNVLGLYARPHFKEMLPALSLTSALALAYLTDEKGISLRGLLIIIWISFFPKTTEPYWGLKKTLKPTVISPGYIPNQADEEAEKMLGNWIRSVTNDSDLVYVAGYGARVQVYSERISPALYFNITQNNYSKQQIYKDLEHSPPALIIVPAFNTYKAYVDQDVRDYIDEFVRSKYRLETTKYGYYIYRKV